MVWELSREPTAPIILAHGRKVSGTEKAGKSTRSGLCSKDNFSMTIDLATAKRPIPMVIVTKAIITKGAKTEQERRFIQAGIATKANL